MNGNARRLMTVILHYGDVRSTARLHDQLLTQSGGSDIRVLDNAAPVPYARAWQRLDENVYWAGALAYCLEQAKGEGFSHLWFLNNDLVFLRDGALAGYAWHRLQKIEARLGRIAIYSPTVIANPYHRQMERLEGGDFRTVSYLDGIAPLISLQYWGENGLDWTGNPIGYGVDVFFSMQAPLLGWKLVADHTLIMRHRYHETARTVPGFMNKAAAQEKAYLNSRIGTNYKQILHDLSLEFSEY